MPDRKILRIGITGSIGMGKSETAKLFGRLGIPVYDSDQAVHALYDQGGAAVPAIAALFPDAVREGRVDRKILSAHVTKDPQALRALEQAVHPLVAQIREDFAARAAAEGAEFVVLDIPLLYETSSVGDVDVVVVASAPEAMQRERVLSRPGMTAEVFATLAARQIPDAEKRAKADFVIDTGQGLDHAFEAVKHIIAALRPRNTHRT